MHPDTKLFDFQKFLRLPKQIAIVLQQQWLSQSWSMRKNSVWNRVLNWAGLHHRFCRTDEAVGAMMMMWLVWWTNYETGVSCDSITFIAFGLNTPLKINFDLHGGLNYSGTDYEMYIWEWNESFTLPLCLLFSSAALTPSSHSTFVFCPSSWKDHKPSHLIWLHVTNKLDWLADSAIDNRLWGWLPW